MNAQLQHCPRWPVIGLMDANSSRLGSVTSRAVGEAGMTVENTAGAWFHEWLLHNEFWLPSTFENTHQGEHHTWYHATGASARLDYVTLSEHFTPSQVRSWVSTDIDVSLQRIDHLPWLKPLRRKDLIVTRYTNVQRVEINAYSCAYSPSPQSTVSRPPPVHMVLASRCYNAFCHVSWHTTWITVCGPWFQCLHEPSNDRNTGITMATC